MQFPIYTQKATMSTDVAKFQQSNVDYSPLIEAGTSIVKQWQKAKDVTETNQAYNNIEQGVNDILQRASEDSDYKNEQIYKDELNKLRQSQFDTFSSESSALEFQRVADSSTNRANAKLEGMFRNKMIEHQQGQVVRSQALNKQGYMSGDLNAKEINKGILKENLDSGFISDIMYQKGIQDMENWDYERAQQDVATNPEFVLNNIDGYGLNEEQKAEVRSDAESLVKKNNELSIIKQLEIEELTASELVDVINSDIPDIEKTQAIQSQVLLGNISKEFANNLNKLMVSEKAINAVTSDDVMADILQRTYDVSSMQSTSPKDFLTGIQNIRNEIIKKQLDGVLTQEDANSINRQVATITSNKTAESTSFISYSYSQSKDAFEKQLPPEYRNKAMRQLFYKTKGQNLSESEYKELSLQVIDEINQERRGVALTNIENIDTMNNEFLAKNNITMEQVKAQAQKSNITEAEVIRLLKQKIGG